MSEALWEDEAAVPKNFEYSARDKWEGEDEDDEVKDSWEDVEEEQEKEIHETQNEQQGTEVKAYQKKKKKPLVERISEKKIEKQLRLEEKTEDETEEPSAEQLLEEKIMRKNLQEESDLQLAKDTFGAFDCTVGIDGMSPVTEDDFVNFEHLLKEKISAFEKSKHYPGFLERLFTDLAVGLETEDVKRLNNSISCLYHEKLKQQRDFKKESAILHDLKEQDKRKKKKSKASLKVGRANDEYADIAAVVGNVGGYDNFEDDFM